MEIEKLKFHELTKKFEEHIGGNLDEVIDYFQGKDVTRRVHYRHKRR